MTNIILKKIISIEQVEEAHDFAPKGLIPTVITDYNSGKLLMHSSINEKVLKKPLL
tara:strand:+ start:219 stop:386 length:168 start_codon:yes stop_codon:yes gene_type:complete